MVASPNHRAESLLARLHALEWRHDGPIPREALAALDAAPAELARREAAADGALMDRLAREAVRAAAARRHAVPGAAHDCPGSSPMARCRAAGLALRPAGR